MSRKRFTVAQTISHLREAERRLAQGHTIFNTVEPFAGL